MEVADRNATIAMTNMSLLDPNTQVLASFIGVKKKKKGRATAWPDQFVPARGTVGWSGFIVIRQCSSMKCD